MFTSPVIGIKVPGNPTRTKFDISFQISETLSVGTFELALNEVIALAKLLCSGVNSNMVECVKNSTTKFNRLAHSFWIARNEYGIFVDGTWTTTSLRWFTYFTLTTRQTKSWVHYFCDNFLTMTYIDWPSCNLFRYWWLCGCYRNRTTAQLLLHFIQFQFQFL